MRVLALDVGGRRIGVAVSDPTGTLARPLTTLTRRGHLEDAAVVASLAAREGAGLVVVGLPITLRGEVGPQARAVLAFIDALRDSLTVPVLPWDERLSTAQAEALMRRQGQRPSRQRERVDALAAALILQSYLDSRRCSSSA